MIEAGEVGAVLTVVDRASAILSRIAAEFDRLDVIARKTQAAFDTLKLPSGMAGSVGKVAAGFDKVGTSAEAAAKMVTSALGRMDTAIAATEARVLSLAGAMRSIGAGGVGRIGGGGSRGGGGHGGSGGVHVGGPTLPIPGGHVTASQHSDGFWELIGGVAMLEAAKKFVESNMEMGRLEARAAASKTTSDRMGEIMNAAWKNAAENLNTTATQSYRYILELTQVTGSVDDALRMLPIVSKLQANLSSLKDENLKQSLGNSNNAYTTARSLELLGVTQDPAKLNSYAATLLQAFSGMQGTLNPQALFQTIQNAGGSRYGWNEDFVKHYLGPLTQASNRAGSGLYQLDRSYGAGVMTELMANNLLNYGFIKKEDEQRDAHGRFKGINTGSIAGYDMLRSNPEEWALKVAIPLLSSHGVDVNDTNSMSKAIQEISRGNKNLGVILDELLLPGTRAQLAKEAANIDSVQGNAGDKDPWLKVQAFQSKWNDLMNALGGPLTANAMGVLDTLTKTISEVAQTLQAHPALATIAADAITVAGGLLLLSGSLAILKVALSGFSLFGGGAAGAAAGGAVAGAGGGLLGGFMARVMPTLAVWSYEDQIKDGIASALSYLFGAPGKSLPPGVKPPTVASALSGLWGHDGGPTNGPPNRLTRGDLPYLRNQDLQGIGNEGVGRGAVNANLQATVNTTVPFTVQIDGQTVANAIMPRITQLINQAMTAAAGQLMGHTNEVAAYHGSGIGHN